MFTKVLRSFGMRGRVLTLDAPISGDVIPLSEVNDQTFATGLLGQGVAIQPAGTRVIAPADAKVEAIFPTVTQSCLASDKSHLATEGVLFQGRPP